MSSKWSLRSVLQHKERWLKNTVVNSGYSFLSAPLRLYYRSLLLEHEVNGPLSLPLPLPLSSPRVQAPTPAVRTKDRIGAVVPPPPPCLSLLLLTLSSPPLLPRGRMSRSPELKDDLTECPLCMEPLEIDDVNFFPCTCGYQICRFCWHRIRTDENGLCPACRKVCVCVCLCVCPPVGLLFINLADIFT